MECLISQVMDLELEPVALLWHEGQPTGAYQLPEGKPGCIMELVTRAAHGETTTCDQKTAGCLSAGLGLGLESRLKKFPGGPECYCYYLSIGNKRWERGRQVGELVRMSLGEEYFSDFMEGRRYFRTPELARKFLSTLPTTEIQGSHVTFMPLKKVDPREGAPQSVIFLVNPNQLAALTTLVGYSRTSFDNILFPQAASCQAVGIFPYREALAIKPRAVVGLADIHARSQAQCLLGSDKMSFTIPFSMLPELEQNVWGSFLEGQTWKDLSSSDSKESISHVI